MSSRSRRTTTRIGNSTPAGAPRRQWRFAAVAALAVGTMGLAACSSSGGSDRSSPPASTGAGVTQARSGAPIPSGMPAQINGGKSVTLTWWHNANTDPGKSAFAKVASDFEAMYPNVKIDVQPYQNETIKQKIAVALQGTPPDIFQEWGGGALATQVKSGKLGDITQYTQSWIGALGKSASGWAVDGKQYAVPYDYHTVGFWYDKDLFQKAGITSPPKTWTDMYADITKLKKAGIVPIALGGKDKWPDAFYWEAFVLRECPQSTIVSSLNAQKLSDPCFVKAGQDTQKLIASDPFNKGFLATSSQQGAGSSAGMVANGKAAMELQGDWEMAVMPALTSDKNFASHIGFFPFPTVTGGNGTPGAALGGGDGFACSNKAPQACAAFLQYLTSVPVETALVKVGAVTIPSNGGATAAIQTPALKAAFTYLQGVSYNQLYFDQYLPTNVGNAVDSAVANFFAGQGTPQSLADSVAQAAH